MRLVNFSDATLEKRQDDARLLRKLADQVEAGDVIEFVAVANDKTEGVFMSIGSFADRWRILGALEYAKQSVHDN